jgi:hypothetical protein
MAALGGSRSHTWRPNQVLGAMQPHSGSHVLSPVA